MPKLNKNYQMGSLRNKKDYNVSLYDNQIDKDL